MCFGDGGCDFLARGGIPGHVPGHALLFSGSLINSVQAIPFSFLSLEAFSAGNALLFSGSLINSVQAIPFSFQASVIFCTRKGLLRYGICAPCEKQAPGVRDAFSEAFGVKNRLLRYGIDIRCQKQAPGVRDASSKARSTADSTDCGQPPAAPAASSVRETAVSQK